MDNAILQLDQFSVSFGGHDVLTNITLTIPSRGVTVLLGPVSTGKSTLLRTLAGYNSAQPAFRYTGTMLYAGAPPNEHTRPALVSQNARLMLDSVFENMASALPERDTLTKLQQRSLIERLLQRADLGELCDRLNDEVMQLPLGLQRRLAIARTVAPNPHLLLLDEPTAGLSDSEAEAVLNLIKIESERRAVLMVTHNQEHAQAVASQVALLVGGEIRETSAARDFFGSPSSEVGRQFVRTGSCSMPEPEQSEMPDESLTTYTVNRIVPSNCGPRGFMWLIPGLLAGTPRPGIVTDVDYDLESLQRVGVNVLVTLEEEPFDAELLSKYNIKPYHLPIVDMRAPTVAETRDLCQQIDQWNQSGTVVAVHCRAGLGRTGTILACQLIWRGKTALDALDKIRQIEPRWVQSEEQVEHLKSFYASLKH